MPSPDNFYALLFQLFQQITLAPTTPPVIPTEQKSYTLQEQQLLQTLQGALAAIQTHNQAHQAEVAARQREQTTLLEVSQTLASALELKPGLILDQLRVINDYTHAVLFALKDLTLVTLAVRGSQQLEETMPVNIQLGEPEMLATLFNGHKPQRIADVWSDDPAAQFLRSLLVDQAPMLLAGMRAWMWVPLAVKGRIVGGIGVAHTKPDHFTAHHAALALIVANQAAITLVNAHLYEQAQSLATLQERQRLAQNLHDAVNQSLFSASLIAEVLPRLWEQNPAEGRKSLEDLRRLTRGAMAEMRGLLAELRPLVLTDTDLGDLLRQLGDALTGRTNIPVTVTITGQAHSVQGPLHKQATLQENDALPAGVQVAFYRLCQEALNNITKHAKASRVTIDLQYNVHNVTLQIHDNGRGFDPAHIPSGHYGLAIMRERAKAISATFSVTSQPGHGTDIAICWEKFQQSEAV